jgi:DNA-binding CsgD family transcriptional regulator
LSGPDSLTPSELRVARLAAEGRSNPEIAHQLFLTRRTVETHLTHAYQKLEIASRGELAAALGKQAGLD